MSWFNKKPEKQNSELPDLPELPELPEITPTKQSNLIKPTNKPLIRDSSMLPSLPSFPNSETANRMSQAVIKSALSERGKPYTQELGSPGRFRMERSEEEVSEPSSNTSPTIMPRARERTEPIFVRIDRFQAASKSLNEVKMQIMNIETVLGDIKKIRAQEEQELQEWEHEILDTKTKLESIDKTLFSKLE